MGIITIAFDDGYKDTFDSCAHFLTENGVRATFAISPCHIDKTLENRPVVSRDNIQYLINNGHEIASHTLTHRNLLTVFNSEGEEAVKNEMEKSKISLESTFKIEVESFVFPFIIKNQDERLRKLSSGYYASSRTTTEDFAFNDLPLKDPYSIMGTAMTTDLPMSEYNKLVDIAQKNDLWLIEVFHLVSTKNTKSAHRDEDYRFFTHLDAFKEHINYILSKKVPILTQEEASK